MRRIVDGGIVLALITAFLYSLGIANYNGYFSAIGVQSGFMSIGSRQVLYNSIFVVMKPLLYVVVFAFPVFVLMRVLATVYTDISRSSYKLKRSLVKLRAFLGHGNKESKAEKYWSDKVDRAVPVFLLIAIFLGGLLYAEHEGKKEGRGLLRDMSNNSYDPKRTVEISSYDNRVYVIACGDNNCAGVTVNDVKVVYFENKFSYGEVSSSTGNF